MASVSKNVDIDKLDEIVNKYNNTYHGTTKMKPVDAKSKGCINFGKVRLREYLYEILFRVKRNSNF